MSSISFSVVGFGRIGQRHAKIIHEHPECTLASVCDTDAQHFDQRASLGFPELPTYSDINDLIQAEQTSGQRSDVVTIATPNGFHAPYAVKLLRAGYHVVIEKPMGIKSAECEEVLIAEKETGKHVFVVKQNRYSPPSVWLKDIVQSGTLGDILMVQTNCYWNRDQRYYSTSPWRGSLDQDGGALYTQFSHFVDLMYWVFGDITNIQSTVRNFTHPHLKDFDDSGFAQFEFLRGGIGSINYSTSCWDTNMESSITVVGSKGSVKVGGQYMNEIEYCHVENYEKPTLPPTNPPNDYGPYKGSAANHHYVFQNVVDVLTARTDITATAFEGLKVVQMIERIYDATR
jgi:UDP-N-acetyl-2-amino-2-deoxyglucuronate dehydrogenase